MTASKHRLYAIRGITHGGRTFRPSDWAERLAGALSSFRPKDGTIGAHIRYSPYCIPRVLDGVKCVIVNDALRDIEPMAWDFVMNFARDNELPVLDVPAMPKPQLHEVGRTAEPRAAQRQPGATADARAAMRAG